MTVSSNQINRITRATQLSFVMMLVLMFGALTFSVHQGVLSLTQATNTAYRTVPGLLLVALMFWVISFLQALESEEDGRSKP